MDVRIFKLFYSNVLKKSVGSYNNQFYLPIKRIASFFYRFHLSAKLKAVFCIKELAVVIKERTFIKRASVRGQKLYSCLYLFIGFYPVILNPLAGRNSKAACIALWRISTK